MIFLRLCSPPPLTPEFNFFEKTTCNRNYQSYLTTGGLSSFGGKEAVQTTDLVKLLPIHKAFFLHKTLGVSPGLTNFHFSEKPIFWTADSHLQTHD